MLIRLNVEEHGFSNIKRLGETLTRHFPPQHQLDLLSAPNLLTPDLQCFQTVKMLADAFERLQVNLRCGEDEIREVGEA